MWSLFQQILKYPEGNAFKGEKNSGYANENGNEGTKKLLMQIEEKLKES